ncbi:MAG TPA: DUF1573 domain-containing protein, partial [Bacteroidia bacterium]|nr:DUF1573 domain-containing protein [Bacteroidia bacterium]
EHVAIKNPITEGETIEVVFSFTNTGNAPLVIKAVQPACGCTVTDDWPKDPIPAGGKGKIKAKFDSSHKPGENTKAITITTNAPRPKDMFDIKFTVKVNPKEENKQ